MSLSELVRALLVLLICGLVFVACDEGNDDGAASGGGSSVNPVDPSPSAVAFVGRRTNGVDVVDVDLLKVIGTIPDAGGYRQAVTPDGTKLYSVAGHQGNGSLIWVSDTATRTVTTEFDPSADFKDLIASELECLAMTDDGSLLYVVDEMGDTAVFVIDTVTDDVVAAAELDLHEPENADVSPDGKFLYVADNLDLTKINTSTLEIVGSISAPDDNHGVALNGDGSKAYIGNNFEIMVVDTETMKEITIILGAGGYYIGASADGNTIYGVNEGTLLAVVDTSTDTRVEVNLAPFSGSSRGVTTTPDGMWVLVSGQSGLVRLDAATLAEITTLRGSYYSVVTSD